MISSFMTFLWLGALLAMLGVSLVVAQAPVSSDSAESSTLPSDGTTQEAIENLAERSSSSEGASGKVTTQVVAIGDVFSIKIVLTTASDIIILSYLDKAYLENLGLVRGEEDVFFTFRAKQLGQTKLIFDRLTATLEPEYLSYTIVIAEPVRSEPVLEETLTQAEKDLRDEAEQEQKAYYNLIQTFIISKDIKAAERAFLDYNAKLSSEYPHRLNVIIELADLYREEKLYEKARALVLSELNASDQSDNVSDRRRLQFSKGYLERVLGDYEAAFRTWLDLKRTLARKSPYYGRVLFELAETLFATEQYRSAEREYRAYLMYYAKRKKQAPVEHYFNVLYRLASIYETDDVLRDYRKAYRYYKDAEQFYNDHLQQTDLAGERYTTERKTMRERIQFISDHFINVR